MPDAGSDELFEYGDAGPIVSALVPLPSDPNLVSVRVGRRAVARLRAVDAESIELEVGAPWTESLAASIDRLRAKDKIRRTALRMLGHRTYSRAELAERLAQRQCDDALIGEVTDELEAGGWIDDSACARQVIEEACRKRPAGDALLMAKLRSRGIDEEIARLAVRKALGETNPVDAAETLARQRLEGMGATAPSAAMRRIAGLLARRGFDDDTIRTVMDRLELVDDSRAE